MRFWAIFGDPDLGTTNAATASVTITPESTPVGITQPGTSDVLDPGDNRFQNGTLSSNGLSIWTVGTESCQPVPNTFQDCLRLIEIGLTSSGAFNNVLADFDVGYAYSNYYYGALTNDASGNMLGISGVDSPNYTVYPSVLAMEFASGTFSATVVVNGNTFSGTQRYGDYSGCGIDPARSNIYAACNTEYSLTSNVQEMIVYRFSA